MSAEVRKIAIKLVAHGYGWGLATGMVLGVTIAVLFQIWGRS